MKILCLNHNLSYNCCWLSHANDLIHSAISTKVTCQHQSAILVVFCKHTCHVNPSAAKKYLGSSSYISMQFLQKLSNTLVNSSVSLRTYKLRYQVLCSKMFPDSFCVFVISICDVFHHQIAVKFSYFRERCFIKSFQLSMYSLIKTFLQYEAEFFKYSITKFVGVLESFGQIFSKFFLILSLQFIQLNTNMLYLVVTYSRSDLQSLHLCFRIPQARLSVGLNNEVGTNLTL